MQTKDTAVAREEKRVKTCQSETSMGRLAVAKLIHSIATRRGSWAASQSRIYASAPAPPPAVFGDKNIRVIFQGITGKNGTFNTKQAIAYGTKMVALSPSLSLSVIVRL